MRNEPTYKKKHHKARITATILSALFTVFLFAGCAANTQKTKDTESLSVVTTIFPEYDWVRVILGEKAESAKITMLSGDGVDFHSYQPSVEDIQLISSCDVFVYVGGESDGWVEDVLKNAQNENMVVVNLLEVLGENAKEEEIVEGMQEEAEEEEEAEEAEYDEHVWLSLRNAEIFCNAISEGLGKADPDNAELYKANAADYIGKIKDLDARYEEAAENGEVKTVLFADRFPFRYLIDDYNLDYYAAFTGCSAETQAGFDTIYFLSEKVDELGLGVILTIENNDGRVATTVRDNTKTKDQEILVLDSMQSVTEKAAEDGVTYLGIMESNLEILKKALK